MDASRQQAISDYFSKLVELASSFVNTVTMRVWTGSGMSATDIFGEGETLETGSTLTYRADVVESPARRMVFEGGRSSERTGRAILSAALEETTVDAMAAALALFSGSSVTVSRHHRAEVCVDGTPVALLSIVKDRLAETVTIDFSGRLQTP